jgi:hypothetical protein
LAALLGATLVVGARAEDGHGSPDDSSRGISACMACEPALPGGRLQASGSLLYLQPGSGNLVYSTLISPLPLLTPQWSDQAVDPGYTPAFNVGLRCVISDDGFDVGVDWTHLNSHDSASAAATGSDRLGPSFLIGLPPPFTSASAVAHFGYDAVNLDAGLLLRPRSHLQLRAFAGVQVARVSQTLSANFLSPDGATSFTDVSRSVFTGAGPRLGVDVHYLAGNFDFLGAIAGAGLIGTAQSHMDFVISSPTDAAVGLTPNRQSLTSPSSTRVIPCLETRLGVGYAIPLGQGRTLRGEAGYEAAMYFNAINQYSLTESQTVGSFPFEDNDAVFLRTAVEQQSNFWVHGPYLKIVLEF